MGCQGLSLLTWEMQVSLYTWEWPRTVLASHVPEWAAC